MLIMSGALYYMYILTPGPARGREGRAGEGGEPGWHQVFVFEQDILIPLELVCTQ